MLCYISVIKFTSYAVSKIIYNSGNFGNFSLIHRTLLVYIINKKINSRSRFTKSVTLAARSDPQCLIYRSLPLHISLRETTLINNNAKIPFLAKRSV